MNFDQLADLIVSGTCSRINWDRFQGTYESLENNYDYLAAVDEAIFQTALSVVKSCSEDDETNSKVFDIIADKYAAQIVDYYREDGYKMDSIADVKQFQEDMYYDELAYLINYIFGDYKLTRLNIDKLVYESAHADS